MGSEFFADGKKYISSKRAAEISGYANDYVGQLCRKHKLECRLVGRAWFVTEESLFAHIHKKQSATASSQGIKNKVSVLESEPVLETEKISLPAPAQSVEIENKIKIQKEPFFVSNIPDSWDASLFSEMETKTSTSEESLVTTFKFQKNQNIKKEVSEVPQQKKWNAQQFLQKRDTSYSDSFSQKIKKDIEIDFRNADTEHKNISITSPFYSNTLFLKTLTSFAFIIIVGLGTFYLKDVVSVPLANILSSKNTTIENITVLSEQNRSEKTLLPQEQTIVSRITPFVDKAMMSFGKKLTYVNKFDAPSTYKPLAQNIGEKEESTVSYAGILSSNPSFNIGLEKDVLSDIVGSIRQGFVLVSQGVYRKTTDVFADVIDKIQRSGDTVVSFFDRTMIIEKEPNVLDRQELSAAEKQLDTKQKHENIISLVNKKIVSNLNIKQNIIQGYVCVTDYFLGDNSCFIQQEIQIPEEKKVVVEESPVAPDDEIALLRAEITRLKEKGVSVSAGTQQTVVERVIERVAGGISQENLVAQLNVLENELRKEISKVNTSSQGGIRIVERQVALTNKIDQLVDATLVNATVSGNFSGLTDAHIPDTITASNYLLTSGGVISGTLGIGTSTPTEDFAVANRIYVGGTGTSTIENNLNILGSIAIGNVCINCDSSGGLSGGGISASATSTFGAPLVATYVPPNAHTFPAWAVDVANSQVTNASLVINPASAAADTNLLGIAVNDGVRFLVDAEGDVFANSLTSTGGETLSTTSISTLTVENNSSFGDSTTTDKTYFNSRIGTHLIPTSDNTSDIGDTTNGLAWRTGIFGTSVGVGTTSPAWPLSVGGIGSFDDYVRASYFVATSTTESLFAGGFISSASSSVTTLSGDNLFASSTIAAPVLYALDSEATSTFSGFIDVSGTNSTSTFSGGLAAAYLNLTGTAATSTFANGLVITDGGISLAQLPSCTGSLVLETDGNGVITCGADEGGSPAFEVISYSGSPTFLAPTTTPMTLILGLSSVTGLSNYTDAAQSLLALSATSSETILIHASSTANATGDFLRFTNSEGATLFSVLSGGGFIGAASSTVSAEFNAQNIFASSTIAAPVLYALDSEATSTFSGFIDVSGTNSTSTFSGGLAAGALSITGNATSTLINGITIEGGCFSINGTCVGGGGGGVGSGTIGQVPYYAADGTSLTATSSITISTQEYVGISSTTPWRRLSVSDTVSNPQFVIAYDSTSYASLQVDSVGDLILDPSGDDAYLNADNFWVCTGGSCPSGTPSGTGNLIVETALGIASSTPWGGTFQYELAVEGDANITGTTTIGNQFSFAPIVGTTTEIGLYNTSGSLILIFDEWQ